MTAPIPEYPGPLCDFCGQEEAMGSLMQLATYEQQKFGPACAPAFLRSVADAIEGVPPAEPESPAPADPGPAAGAETAAVAGGPGEPPDDDGEPGSAQDHWASTRTVVRSTHGHRGGRKTAGPASAGSPPATEVTS